MLEYEIGAGKMIFNPPVEIRQQITDSLTLPNPAFLSAEIYSPYKHVYVDKYLYYYAYDRGTNTLEIPRGYKIPGDNKCIGDNRVSVFVDYPKFKLNLRATQKEAVSAYLGDGRDNGDGLIVLPTGKGKSILAIYLFHHLQQKALVIVHKDDLVDGWKKDIQLCLGIRPKKIGLIKAKEFRIGEQITITTIQTLSRLPYKVQQELFRTFGVICVDELHHVGASTYEYSGKFLARDRLGLTATDIRSDGLGGVMNFHFGNACYRFTEEEGAVDEDIISAKDVLIKVRESDIVYTPPSEYLVAGTNRKAEMVTWNGKPVSLHSLKEWQIDELILSRIIARKPMDYHAVKKLISENDRFNALVCRDVFEEYKQGKSILVFCSLKEHCRTIYNILGNMGVPEEKMQLYYGDASESKESMKKKAESGKVQITIATYAIATEGTNVKRWERIFLAGTFNNEKDTIQAVGRGRRRMENKENLIVYDYSHPFIKGVRNHINTRKRVYKKLGFTFVGSARMTSKQNFQRGFPSK